MKKRQTQTEKLFNNEELSKLTKKLDSLELMEKIEANYGLTKIFNNTQYAKTNKVIKRLTRS